MVVTTTSEAKLLAKNPARLFPVVMIWQIPRFVDLPSIHTVTDIAPMVAVKLSIVIAKAAIS
jgi:hypothetical protein